ncbi:hypothetical protein QFZ82_003185 [Streptomyces sp. V4I23]|uniref:hypothetical protein n=1 Tax=Streptomyces sp. V4I23 TaxID=3042282 RepID=UPI0027895BF0|nr:hypothetical protein [Streptomyces sp. V4I23]MDQ1008700.1 hypothetical protein [Streptomyces sp. V4I23]
MNSHFVTVKAVVIPKQGNSEVECEDSYCVIPKSSLSEQCFGPVVAVISDGASESMFARAWSNMIARRVAHRAYWVPEILTGPGPSFRYFINQLVGHWERWLARYIDQRVTDGRPLRWYEEAKLASGAFATLLAVRLDYGHAQPVYEGKEDGFWHAAALGDSCVFQLRGQEVISLFPIEYSADFGNTPNLLGSNANRDLVCQRTAFFDGSFRHGDDFFLMTDALAAWFLSTVENTHPGELKGILDQLRRFSRTENRSAFKSWLSSLMASGALQNDDITLMHICTSG